jgi:ABC-2 type transport system permease protein
MKKVFHVAVRDFVATVTTRGFIIALLLPPVFYAAVGVVFPRLMNDRTPRVSGQVAVIDSTGQVAARVKEFLGPEAIAERRRGALIRARGAVIAGRAGASRMPGADRAVESALGPVPEFEIVLLPPEAQVTAEKGPLKGGARTGGRLALVVVHPDAVIPVHGAKAYGTYDLFVRPGLDDRIQTEIVEGIGSAIIAARASAEGLDWRHLRALASVERPRPVTVTGAVETQTATAFTRFLPVAFMVLLMMSVMSSGQYLMTTTIEEKSSRTMEVILSAVSPMQLMMGKILGQMAVGLLVLTLYSSAGLLALVSMALFGLLDLTLLVYLLIFFLITYLVIGSLMAAIGSAVNELREAQALLMPVTLTMMTPWIFWFPIVRDPNSLFATTLSFVPPMSAFAMVLRLTSTSPPPFWQVWLSIGIGLAAAAAALWFASRVFRIGLLMHGRPPNFATLVRWARQA